MRYYNLISLMPKTEPLLLDLFPNAASAYSLRKLRTAYTGNCIRVRRSSDNTETDIGFVNNYLDTATLLTFVGANNGFVTTWYDQSGNNTNATQASGLEQLRIVVSGVFSDEYDQNGRFMNLPANVITGNSPRTLFSVVRNSLASGIIGGNTIYSLTPTTGALATAWNICMEQTDMRIRVEGNAGFAYPSPYNSLSPSIITNIYAGSGGVQNVVNYQNGILMPFTSGVNSTVVLNTNNGNGFLNRYTFATPIATGWRKEYVFYASDQSANRAAIEGNINSFYNIYP